MADLHETLEKRERRSKLVSFLVGSAIILAIVVGVVWFNNRDNGGEVVDEGVNITATEDSNDSDSDGGSADDDTSNSQSDDSNDADTSVVNGDNDDRSNTTDASDETGSAEDESDSDDEQAVATTGGTDSDGELPNTGPEHAAIGLIGVVVAARLFVTTRSSLDSTLRS